MSDIDSRRITDCTPEQIGDGVRFEISSDRTNGWVVFARWDGTGDNEFDGRGEGPTIEAALTAAITDMNED